MWRALTTEPTNDAFNQVEGFFPYSHTSASPSQQSRVMRPGSTMAKEVPQLAALRDASVLALAESKSNTCAVCLEEFDFGSAVPQLRPRAPGWRPDLRPARLGCGHVFHAECARQHLRTISALVLSPAPLLHAVTTSTALAPSCP